MLRHAARDGRPAAPAPPSQEGALPTFIVVGGMKCGTTSLYRYLRLHPEIGMPAEKELAFFVDAWNWDRGRSWYRRQFDPQARIRGEASPQYTCFPKYRRVPERMHALVPEAKLIYVVRDPVDRLLSHYRHNAALGGEPYPLAEAIHLPERSYLAQSRYHFQLQQYLRYYDREAFLIVDQRDLRHRRRETLREVFAFVGADPHRWDVRFRFEWHRSARKRRRTVLGERLAATWPMRQVARLPTRYRWVIEDAVYWPLSRPAPAPDVPPALRAEITALLAEDAARFRAFTGRDFPHWSV